MNIYLWLINVQLTFISKNTNQIFFSISVWLLTFHRCLSSGNGKATWIRLERHFSIIIKDRVVDIAEDRETLGTIRLINCQ